MSISRNILFCVILVWANGRCIRGFTLNSNTSRVAKSIRSNKNLCTGGCSQSVAFIKNNLDSTVDPCDNFYDFVCGGLKTARADVGSVSFNQVNQITLRQLRAILSQTKTENDIRPLQMAKAFYASCVADDTIQTSGRYAIYDKIRAVISHWPLTTTTSDSWIDVVRKLRKMGFGPNYIASIFILNHPTNSSSKILTIGLPMLGLPAVNLRKGFADAGVKKYYQLMEYIAEDFESRFSFFSPFQRLLNRKFVQEIFQFEIKLAQISPTTSEIREDVLAMFEPTTIEQVEKKYSSIEWQKYIQAILSSEIGISKQESIGIVFHDFMDDLNKLIFNTPNRILINYIAWRCIYFSFKLTFAIGSRSRWKSCVSYTVAGFDDVIRSQYIRHYFHDQIKDNIAEMVERIKAETRKRLTNSDWLDTITKQRALNKLNAIIHYIGHPGAVEKQEEKFIAMYQNLHIDSNNYYGSVLNISKFILDTDALNLRKPTDRTTWPSFLSPIMANAFYVPSQNSIVIPAALLQNVFYSVDRPDYLNYGAVGFIIGHELSHAFDDYGSNFDENGNFKNWWQLETKKKYAEKIECFVSQYENIRIDEIDERVDGRLTLGENIADNIGIEVAYNAYLSLVTERGVEQTLPGLNYTPQQLFWISSASIWCTKYNSNYLRLLVSIDNHSPPMVRVNGQVSNQPEFAKDFSCPAGSRMNPTEKCSFWTE